MMARMAMTKMSVRVVFLGALDSWVFDVTEVLD
jgi:hypothetical protein